MIDLPDVTLVSVSSVRIPETLKSLAYSMSKLNFAKALFISHELPDTMPDKVDFIKIPEPIDIMGYNRFIFFDLFNYIPTTHCLIIQYDSTVIHPELWDNQWLNYDYIGAPWAYREDAYVCHDTKEHVRVGNGGFSLRSKKLLEIPTKHNLQLVEEQGFYSEDGNFCVYHRKKMLELGIKYAPLEEAVKFSYETRIPENFGVSTFGFHKNINPW